ncbi:MAG: hypothetical protein QOC75_2224, partial [Pseudonocardiales bacterium]|nr:hypothetical protein [Pseudonocardiales bacterium]
PLATFNHKDFADFAEHEGWSCCPPRDPRVVGWFGGCLPPPWVWVAGTLPDCA